MKFLTAIYIVVMCVFLPIYMKDGYHKLGEAKGLAFLWISGIALGACVLGIGIYLLRLKKAGKQIDKERLIVTARKGAFLLAFFGLSIISLAFAVDRKVAFFGLDGWRTGFLTWGFAAALAFIIAFWGIGSGKFSKWVAAISLLVPFLMFILGIINRFGIYPFAINGRNNSYLATIGNINWFTGFLSVFVPLGAGLCYREKRFSKGFFLCAIYELVGLAALFLQGSESALLVVGACFGLLAFNGLRDRESFKNFLCQLFILGIAMESAGLLYIILKSSYTYEDSILILTCARHVGLILAAAAISLYRLSCLLGEIKASFKKEIYRYLLIGVAITAGVVVLLYVKNSFSDDFGNGRGVIWRISAMVFSGESFFQKLFGVGPDCYFAFIKTDKEIARVVYDAFDGARLTNAHSELFTILIQNGILGAAAYLGMIFSSLWNLMKIAEGMNSEEDTRLAMVFALPIGAYFLNSLVSFPQTVSTPYFFICIGMGLKLMADHRLRSQK
ncbi:O-antigen ligase family protein [Butyrivibrio sp. MC2021]|uniref:O-antigen ligase family protein n=1 Tax=Butyrivibrio sp. MC2021 TaxID=1408306 RepID=UPI0004796106|nr:O-antigen ligase family protein [Butyrivibrio sp. MC2021]